MKYELKVYSMYELGSRSNQEDCLYPLPQDLTCAARNFVLCDGMGSHDSGEVASDAVCRAMGAYADACNRGDALFTADNLRDALNAAYDALDERDTHAAKKMGTTMTFLAFHAGGCLVAHIGDSRVYHLRPGQGILFETSDHSLVNDLIKVGVLTEETAKDFSHKNVITRVMQPNQEWRSSADIKEITDVRPGDYFFMCSDGVNETMESRDIANVLLNGTQSDADKMRIIKDVTSSSCDNHTAFLIRVERVEGEVKLREVRMPVVGCSENAKSRGEGENSKKRYNPNRASVISTERSGREISFTNDGATVVAGSVMNNENLRSAQNDKKRSDGNTPKRPSNKRLFTIISVAVICIIAAIFGIKSCNDRKTADAEAKQQIETLFAPLLDRATGKWGFADPTGKLAIPCKYDWAYPFSEGFAKVSLDGKWGFVDSTGKLAIPCKYDYADDFSEGLAWVDLDGKPGFVDSTGKLAIPCKYDWAGYFSEGLAMVKLDGKCGFVDSTGKLAIPCKYDDAGYFSEGLAMVKLDGKCGFVDSTGKLAIPCKYDDAWFFSKGLAKVKLDGKCGFVDSTGKLAIPCKYDDAAYSFSEGLARVKLDGKWGFVDSTGKLAIPCKYDDAAFGFSEGLAVVKLNGKYGFVDSTGKLAIPCKYDDAYFFSEGLARVKLDGKCGFVDSTGKLAIPCKYDDAYFFSEGLAEVRLDGKWGFVDSTGKLAIPCKYDRASTFSEGLAEVRLYGGGFYIDKNGKEYIK